MCLSWPTQKAAQFDINEGAALEMLQSPTPHGRPNSDVVVPWINGLDVTRRPRDFWIIDFGLDMSVEHAALYSAPFDQILKKVRPEREKNKRKSYRDRWWIHVEPRPAMRAAMRGLKRVAVTTTVSKHRLFVWFEAPLLPDHQLIAFGRSDDCFFGVLHSRLHEVWARAQGTQVRERESGFRYTPTSCFETFPLPECVWTTRDCAAGVAPASRRADVSSASKTSRKKNAAGGTPAPQAAAIAAAAKELDELRNRWLNPPEWTKTEILEFPGSVDGPWARYIDPATVRPHLSPLPSPLSPLPSVGTVRWPRIVPKDADSAESLKKRTLTNLYNQRPTWLANAHQNLDNAVFTAYGWPATLSDEELLARLLQLNLARAASGPPSPL